MLRKAKHNFFLNLKHANCREFWKAMRYVNKKQTGIPSLSVGTGNLVTDAGEKADALRVVGLVSRARRIFPVGGASGEKYVWAL